MSETEKEESTGSALQFGIRKVKHTQVDVKDHVAPVVSYYLFWYNYIVI